MSTLLDRLLGPLRLDEFLERYYLQSPFGRSADELTSHVAPAWSLIESTLASADRDLLVGSGHQPWTGPLPSSLGEVRELLSQGQTVGFRNVQRNHPWLAQIATEFEAQFAGPVDIHLYCTAAGEAGFGWHYDLEEVFLVQLEGTKEWWLRKNTINPLPVAETMPDDLHFASEGTLALHCTLAPGEWLYIPSGYWHRGRAQSESISLSIGVRASTGLDVLDFVRRQLPARLLWRLRVRPVPGGEPSVEWIEACRAYFAELGRDLEQLFSDPKTVLAFQQQNSAVAPK